MKSLQDRLRHTARQTFAKDQIQLSELLTDAEKEIARLRLSRSLWKDEAIALGANTEDIKFKTFHSDKAYNINRARAAIDTLQQIGYMLGPLDWTYYEDIPPMVADLQKKVEKFEKKENL